MALSVLDLAKKAVRGKGISAPTSLIGGDDFSNQMLALAEEVAADIVKRGDWQILNSEGTFVTVAAESQVTMKTEFPYLRKIIDGTVFNRTQNHRMRLVSPQTWQAMKSSNVVVSDGAYRIRGGVFIMPDTTEAGDTIAFEYIDTRPFVDSSGSTLREHIESDDDMFRLDDDLMTMGLRWKFLAAKGLEYGEEFRLYEDTIAERLGADKPSEVLNLNGGCGRDDDYYGPSISEGNW